jgi:hypothetical protein
MWFRQLNQSAYTAISTLQPRFIPLCATRTQVNQVRYKKPDIYKHRHAFWERLQLLEFTKPIYKPKHSTTENLWQDCPREKEVQEIYLKNHKANELEILYAAQMKDFFERSSMIGIFHVNPIKGRAQRLAWQNARRQGMELQKYNNRICREALHDTKWKDSVMFLVEMGRMETQFTFDLGPVDKVDPARLLAYDKKVPEFILLAGIIGDRMLDRAGLIHAANNLYPRGIESQHAELSAILQSPAEKIRLLLGRNQQQFSEHLQQYVKDQQSDVSSNIKNNKISDS